MRRLYEQNWKKAVEDAKIEPSKALWHNIVSNLDEEKGRNYWVTILMIAATVTIAFSFPLNIGNSSFDARLDRQQYIGQVENDASSLKQSSDISSVNKIHIQNSISKSLVKNSKSIISHQNKANSVNNIIASIEAKESHSISVNNNSGTIKMASVQGVEFTSLDRGNSFKLVTVNNYYFIPYFMPIKKDIHRNLLASLNMGTGNSSNSGGLLNSFNTENTKVYALSDQNDSFSNASNQYESKGSTFYIGGGIEFSVGKRWALLAGIGYLSKKAEGTNNVVLVDGGGYKPLGVYDPLELGSVFLSESYHYSLTNNYITVPISFKYPLIKRKIKFRAGAGIGTDFMLSHNINSETHGKASYNPSEIAYESVVLSGLVNFDVSYSLSNQYSIALESGIRKGITPIDKNKEFYPSSFTVGIVLFYKIK